MLFLFLKFSSNVQKTAKKSNISLRLLLSSHTLRLSVSVPLISNGVPSCSSALCVTMCLCFSKCMCLKIQEERRGSQGVFPFMPRTRWPLTSLFSLLTSRLFKWSKQQDEGSGLNTVRHTFWVCDCLDSFCIL